MSKDSRSYDCFLVALCNTDQNHIVEILKREDKYIDTEHSLMIQRNYTKLIEYLVVDSGFLLDRLHETGLITVREMATITAKLTKQEKSQTLLALVSRFRPENFSRFLQALEKSSQEHVVNILTGKECPKLESITYTTTAVEARYERKNSESEEKPQRNLELQDHATHNLQKSILHSTKRIKTQSSHVKRKSFLTLGSKFANLPDELQTELSLKVASLRQMTVLPSQANVEICFRKLLKGFIQQKNEVNREQTAFEDVRVMLRRINESAESFTHQSEDKYKAEIRTLSEELGWNRNSKRNLDKTLKTTIIKYNERKKLHKQKIEDLEKERAELRKSMEKSKQCFDDLLRKFEHNQRESNDLREDRDELRKLHSESEQRGSDFVEQLKEYQMETEVLQKQKDELQGSVNELKQQIYDLIKNHKQETEEFDNIVDQLEHQQKESEDRRKERNELRMSVDKSKQRIDELVSQREQDRKETTELLKQKDDLQKQLVALQKQSDEERKLMEASRKTSEALLMNKDGKILELKHKLEQDAKTWAEKEEHLMNKMQELQKELSAELRYKSDPVLVQTIRTKAAEEENKPIYGLTILDNELFVVSKDSSEVEVYDSIQLSFSRRWNLKELIHPNDIGACKRNKCLYFNDYKFEDQSKEILRVDPNGKLIKSWSTGYDNGWGLSVTEESTVILVVDEKNKFNEYSPDGQLIREIILSSDSGIRHPKHAIKLFNGHFVVSHGLDDDELHRVSIVDADGKLKKSFGGKRGSTIGQMDYPSNLFVGGNGFVMVVDRDNRRVLLLDSDLKFRREILSEEKHGLRRPGRILLDESNGRLFVADNKWDFKNWLGLLGNGRILIFDFK